VEIPQNILGAVSCPGVASAAAEIKAGSSSRKKKKPRPANLADFLEKDFLTARAAEAAGQINKVGSVPRLDVKKSFFKFFPKKNPKTFNEYFSSRK